MTHYLNRFYVISNWKIVQNSPSVSLYLPWSQSFKKLVDKPLVRFEQFASSYYVSGNTWFLRLTFCIYYFIGKPSGVCGKRSRCSKAGVINFYCPASTGCLFIPEVVQCHTNHSVLGIYNLVPYMWHFFQSKDHTRINCIWNTRTIDRQQQQQGRQYCVAISGRSAVLCKKTDRVNGDISVPVVFTVTFLRASLYK